MAARSYKPLRQPRERTVDPARDVLADGSIAIRRKGVIWFSNALADREAEDRGRFDINLSRLAGVELLITRRYGGPCDCDGDVHLYASVALNAFAMTFRVRGWAINVDRLLHWIAEWLPAMDDAEAQKLAEAVAKRPRAFTAAMAGKLVKLTRAERDAYGIRFIHPIDETARERAAAKNTKRTQRRREAGVRSREEVAAKSIRAFCARYDLVERTFRAARQRGPEAFAKFLRKHGLEKVAAAWFHISLEDLLIRDQKAATFEKADKASPPRPARKARKQARAQRPPCDNPSAIVLPFERTGKVLRLMAAEAGAPGARLRSTVPRFNIPAFARSPNHGGFYVRHC